MSNVMCVFFIQDVNLLCLVKFGHSYLTEEEVFNGYILLTVSALPLGVFLPFFLFCYRILCDSIGHRYSLNPPAGTEEKAKSDELHKNHLLNFQSPVQSEPRGGNNWPLLFWVAGSVTRCCRRN